jgi:hypothetical protein
MRKRVAAVIVFACLQIGPVEGADVRQVSPGAALPEPAQANEPADKSKQQSPARTVGIWQPPSGLKQIPIWPDRAPDMEDVSQPAESVEFAEAANATKGYSAEAAFDVSSPTMTVFPPKGPNKGAAVIVFPGGGFKATFGSSGRTSSMTPSTRNRSET